MWLIFVIIILIPLAFVVTYILSLATVSTLEGENLVEKESEGIMLWSIISVFVIIFGVIMIKMLS